MLNKFAIGITLSISILLGQMGIGFDGQHQTIRKQEIIELDTVNSEEYLPEVFLLMEYGNQSNQVGIGFQENYMNPYGPSLIELDEEGNIYIIDAVNSRVLSVDALKKVNFEFGYNDNYWPVDISVTGDKFYILDGKQDTILEYDLEGNLIHDFPLNVDNSSIIGISSDANNNLLIYGYSLPDDKYASTVNSFTEEINLQELLFSPQNIQDSPQETGFPTSSGSYLLSLINKNGDQGTIHILGENKEITAQVRTSNGGPIGGVNLINTDHTGNFYIKVDSIVQDENGAINIDSSINKLNPDGSLIAVIDLIDDSLTKPNKPIAISATGIIYQMVTDYQGMYLLKYSNNSGNGSSQLPVFDFKSRLSTNFFQSIQIGPEKDDKKITTNAIDYPMAVTRDQAISIAESYRSHVWTVGSSNFYGRNCSNNCPVGDSQWSIGSTVMGVAYKWGGEDSIASFDSKLSQGYIAGDVTGTTCVGSCATGVDCSGFVTNTWQSSRFYTGSIGDVATIISVADVKKADAFNIHTTNNKHVVLFSYLDSGNNPVFYESQYYGSHKVVINSGWGYLSGYTPYRYNNITDGGGTTDCNSVNYNGIVLYADKTCNGEKREFNSEGFRNTSDFNDRASSIYVGTGWSTKVYEHDSNGGLGSSRCITGSMWDLSIDYYTSGNTGLIIDNTISAIDVYHNSSCTGTTVPNTPGNFRVSSATQTSLTLAWDDLGNETGYRIFEWNGANFYLTHTLGANTTSFTDTGLSCGTTYYYELAAFNNSGESSHAGWISGDTTACPTLPTTPSSPSPSDDSILERASDTYLSWNTTGTTCNVHIWGGAIDINPSGGCSNLHLGNQRGGSYSWQVTAQNTSGSTTGPTWHFMIRPYGPTGLTASPTSSNQINLSWTLSSDEPSNIDGYDIYYGNGTLIGSVNQGVSSYSVTGLSCNSSYSFVVRARRQGVQSNNSNTASATTGSCAPNTPGNFRVTTSSQTSITLAWDDLGNETGYRIFEWNGASFFLTHTLGANTTSFTDTGLSCGTTYYYELAAVNNSGESSHAGWISGDTTACPTLPTTPSSPSPSDDSILERASDTYLSWNTTGTTCNVHIWGGAIDINPSGGCSSLHLGNQRGGSYSWQVTAQNTSGSTTGPTWHFMIRPYGPTSLTASATSPNQINLNWTLSSDEPSNIDGYDIYYGNGTLIGSVNQGVSSYSVTGLSCNSSYSFVVRARRQGVQSNNSNTASATTGVCAPNTPNNFRVSSVTRTSLTLAWDDLGNETGYRIFEWNGASFFLTHTLGANTTSFTDTGLSCGSTYYYELAAFNNSGESSHAGWISGDTTACPTLNNKLFIPMIQR